MNIKELQELLLHSNDKYSNDNDNYYNDFKMYTNVTSEFYGDNATIYYSWN